jgi:hypothetical protein
MTPKRPIVLTVRPVLSLLTACATTPEEDAGINARRGEAASRICPGGSSPSARARFPFIRHVPRQWSEQEQTMSRTSAILVAALALTACASQPETPAPMRGPAGATKTLQDLNGSRIAMPLGLFLAGLDTDRDARVTRTEIQDGAAESFKAGDADGNGYLSPIEFEDWSRVNLGTASAVPGLLQFDRDQDTSISLIEFTATLGEIQKRMDTNRDGELDRAELLVQINGLGVDPQAMRAQIEADIRRSMEGRVREMCQRGARGR